MLILGQISKSVCNGASLTKHYTLLKSAHPVDDANKNKLGVSPVHDEMQKNTAIEYHKTVFPFERIYSVWLRDRIYDPSASIELAMENATGAWWRNTDLDGTKTDFDRKVKRWRTVKLHTGCGGGGGGSDMKPLIFDLDLDAEHVNRDGICDCDRSVCKQCWFFLHTAALIFRYLLPRLFGIAQQRIKILFSGGRGLHIWVCGGQWKKPIRRIIVERLKLLGDPSSYWHPIISKHIHEVIMLPIWKRYISDRVPSASKKEIFERLYPFIDEGPTVDTSHNVGCPLSVHTRTGYVIQPLWEDLSEFAPIHHTEVTPQIMDRWYAYLMT